MQRTENNLIIISCDFCGTDWDEHLPMIEGHRGSVLCINCLKLALEQFEPAAEPFECTLALRQFPAGTLHWTHPAPTPSPGLNPTAILSWHCIRMAAKGFHKDKETNFKWDPSHYPPDDAPKD